MYKEHEYKKKLIFFYANSCIIHLFIVPLHPISVFVGIKYHFLIENYNLLNIKSL